jgi:hypothetical protein
MHYINILQYKIQRDLCPDGVNIRARLPSGPLNLLIYATFLAYPNINYAG